MEKNPLALFAELWISSNFDSDERPLRGFLNAGYPKRSICHTVNSFLEDSPEDDNILIPNFFF